jgi:hypothetical protein
LKPERNDYLEEEHNPFLKFLVLFLPLLLLFLLRLFLLRLRMLLLLRL